MKKINGNLRFQRPPKRRFLLFDGRAADGDTASATAICFEDSMHAAETSARSFGEAAIYSFIEGPAPAGSNTDYLISDLRFEKMVRS